MPNHRNQPLRLSRLLLVPAVRHPSPRITRASGSPIMRSAVVAGFFFSAGIAWGAPPKGAINVHVEWINYDELHCEGCRAQTVTMDAGSFFITTHKREGKMIYTKIAGDWVGDAIRVTLTPPASGVTSSTGR